MKEKSKFITFLLSFIPGLSHFYLGFADRGLIFLMAFFGVMAGVVGLAMFIGGDLFAILALGLPLIWLVALLDAFSLMKRFNSNNHVDDENEIKYKNVDELKQSNRKTITMALSIIPGAGHMYLGYQKKGLAIMGAFFFTVFFMGWLGLSLFLFVLPLIWFYSFFDALHSFSEDDAIKEDEFVLPNIKSQWIGWGFITIGILIVIEHILYPLIPHEIRNYIQTSIVSIIFIAGGIKLLNKSKGEEEEGEEICKKDE